jgi:hypothetical protein
MRGQWSEEDMPLRTWHRFDEETRRAMLCGAGDLPIRISFEPSSTGP